jgi:hypothetical protein
MNSSKAKISIIFPSYNGEDVIFTNLKSIENLNNSNEIELIIIDNNSIDSTKEIIKSFKNRLNIKLFESYTNLGFAKACNLAVIKAKGDFIYITNQDVAFPEDFFEILLNLYDKIKKNKEIIISPAVVFPGNYINYYGAKIHFLGFSYSPNMYQKISKNKRSFPTRKCAGCSIFMKRDLFLKLNGFDSNFFMYHEDTDFSLNALRNKILTYTTNETLLLHQKIHMSINEFTYYYIERNRYLVLYKNIKDLISLVPYIIISEFMLLFQAILTKKLKLRLKIYIFLIRNNKTLRYLRTNKINNKTKKLNKQALDRNLDPIIMGRILSNVKILRIFMKLINLIL